MNSIGKYIRQYRTEKKMRQEDLAEKTDLSPNYIGMIERGEKIPSLESLIVLLNALEVSADMVLCEVLTTGYLVKNSIFGDKISKLSKADQEMVYDIIDTIISHKH